LRQQHSEQLLAIERAQYANTVATMNAQFSIVKNADQIAYQQLQQLLLQRDRDHDREHNDLNINMVQNQNQNQLNLLDERNCRRSERADFQFFSLQNMLQAQANNQQVQNKSVTIGSGTSGATSANTANNV